MGGKQHVTVPRKSLCVAHDSLNTLELQTNSKVVLFFFIDHPIRLGSCSQLANIMERLFQTYRPQLSQYQ